VLFQLHGLAVSEPELTAVLVRAVNRKKKERKRRNKSTKRTRRTEEGKREKDIDE
jgi:hypothetical protein